MTNVIGFAALTKSARADAITTKIDAGGGAGTIKFYTGTRPATADTALAGNTLLGTCTFSGTAAPGASSGTLTFSAITDGTAVATGTATFARIADSAAATIFDCDVGTSGAVINLNTTSIVTSGPIHISSFTITEA